MGDYVDDTRRLVIPRWRPFRESAALGQLSAAIRERSPGFPKVDPREIEELKSDWREHRSPVHAANLLDAALMAGDTSMGSEVAEWLLANGGVSSHSTSLAKALLSPTSPSGDIVPGALSSESRFARIAAYRRQLRRYPEDPLLWVDLAREYSALGQIGPARKALEVAIALAPNNRFVLRSASRFFVHTNDADNAHGILVRSPATAVDPWLMSAEIAAAEASGRRSRLVKAGSQLIESARLGPMHTSELASAVGTLELKAGNRRKVRKLFDHALVEPTENTVAQAAWVARHMTGFEVPVSSLAVPRAYEARTWAAVQASDYAGAIALAWDWLHDEPFATRPALFGAWVATNAIGDYAEAIRFAKASMVPNPAEPRVIAELIYCHASLDALDVAEALLPRLEKLIEEDATLRGKPEWAVVLEADRGLLEFRRGNFIAGAAHYERALEIARRDKLSVHYASAFLNYLRERVRANPATLIDRKDVEDAIAAYHPGQREVVRCFASRIRGVDLSQGEPQGPEDEPSRESSHGRVWKSPNS